MPNATARTTRPPIPPGVSPRHVGGDDCPCAQCWAKAHEAIRDEYVRKVEDRILSGAMKGFAPAMTVEAIRRRRAGSAAEVIARAEAVFKRSDAIEAERRRRSNLAEYHAKAESDRRARRMIELHTYGFTLTP